MIENYKQKLSTKFSQMRRYCICHRAFMLVDE